MLDLLKKLYYSAEEIKGKQLYLLLTSVFIFFTFVGFGLNYIIKIKLNNPEFFENLPQSTVEETVQEEQLQGIITYVDPRTYPNEDISYYLADVTGKEIILLKANDDKLKVSDGLFVTVAGKKQKLTSTDKEYLLVDRITVSTK